MSFTIFQNERTPFYAMKTRSSKIRRIYFFPKVFGIFPFFSWNWSKNGRFSNFFGGNIGKEMCFTIFQNEKMPFQAIKTRSLKSRKIAIFPKVVNPWFWSKNGHCSNIFFVKAIQARKMSFTIFQKEKTPIQDIKTRSSKS